MIKIPVSETVKQRLMNEFKNPPPIKNPPKGIYDTNAQGMRMMCICEMIMCLISISVAIVKICL